MKKQLSCGIIFQDITDNILIVRPTNSTYYQIPKGIHEYPDPSYIFTAEREAFEETGIDLTKSTGNGIVNIVCLGRFKYKKHKDLFLYQVIMKELPDINSLHCDSTFVNIKTGQEQPEIDGYKIIKIDDYPRWLNKNMVKVFDQIYSFYSF